MAIVHLLPDLFVRAFRTEPGRKVKTRGMPGALGERGVMKGLVAFSFALRAIEDEPNPCNSRLAYSVMGIVATEKDDVLVVSQWEISRQLRANGHEPECSVDLQPDGSYLDSDIVWGTAKKVFEEHGINEVIPIAQPILQMRKVKRLIRSDGFVVVERPVGAVGFDAQSTQWWTRGPLRLLLYAILQQFTGLHGHSGRKAPT
jgi:hypothetical protein